MPTYRVWYTDIAEEKTAMDITDSGPELAAERFCSATDPRDEEYTPDRNVSVRSPLGIVHEFIVGMSLEPVYTARKKK